MFTFKFNFIFHISAYVSLKIVLSQVKSITLRLWKEVPVIRVKGGGLDVTLEVVHIHCLQLPKDATLDDLKCPICRK